jgi:hypothetical protein
MTIISVQNTNPLYTGDAALGMLEGRYFEWRKKEVIADMLENIAVYDYPLYTFHLFGGKLVLNQCDEVC